MKAVAALADDDQPRMGDDPGGVEHTVGHDLGGDACELAVMSPDLRSESAKTHLSQAVFEVAVKDIMKFVLKQAPSDFDVEADPALSQLT